MADVKWIKIMTDVFDDEKILLIESMPSADSIIVIWFKLLTLAGKMNNDGVFLLSGRIACTDEMLASIFRRDINTVRMALGVFRQLGMIEIIENVITIPNWNKHQTLDAYEKKKQRDRIYQAERRAAQKALVEKSSYKSSDTSADSSSYVAISEGDKEEEKDKDIDIEYKNNKSTPPVPYNQVVELYNSICKSLPAVRAIGEARKKAIKARLNTYTLDDFRAVFENAEASSFLKGSNDRNWTATFDWLVKDTNMAKVLEGNYVDKGKKYGRTEQVPPWVQQAPSPIALRAVQQMLAEENEAQDEDPDFRERADRLKQRMKEKYGR